MINELMFPDYLKTNMPVPVGAYAGQPSCFDRMKVGFMIGFSVGMATGGLFGGFNALR